MPDMVQIGNEVIDGMLWPDGKLPENWDNFADLVRAGIRGVEAGRGDEPRPEIMIHIDRGGDLAATKVLLRQAAAHGIDYDVIGQSYYPWWHGTLLELRENLANSWRENTTRTSSLVEVAYNWRPTEYRDKPGPFPETPEGQRDFLDEVNRDRAGTPQRPRHRHLLVGAGGHRRPAAAAACSTTTATPCR